MFGIKQYTKYILLSFALAFVLLCLTAVLFAYTNINDIHMGTFVFVIVGITNFIGSILVSRKIRKRGMLLGILFGLIYFLVIYILSGISFGFVINTSVFIYILTAILSGMLGGILGVNI